jgi:hypothetical protein
MSAKAPTLSFSPLLLFMFSNCFHGCLISQLCMCLGIFWRKNHFVYSLIIKGAAFDFCFGRFMDSFVSRWQK